MVTEQLYQTYAPKTKSLQGIFSLHSAAATETYSASLCITIIQKFNVEQRDAKISSRCCTRMITEKNFK